MEFKKGDIVTFIGCTERVPDDYKYESDGINSNLIIHGSITWDGKNAEVIGIYNDFVVVGYNGKDGSQYMQLGFAPEQLRLISNSKSLSNITMEKKVYNVLIVNKKTGETDKNEVVVAGDEQTAILKAFGVDSADVFIKVTEQGSFKEEKPVEAILVKEEKK